MPGPWQELGKRVDDLARDHEVFYFARWRNVSLDWVPDAAKPEMQALLSKIDGLVDQKEAERVNIPAKRAWSWSLTFAQ